VAIFRPCGFSLFSAFLPCFLFFVFPFLASVRSFLLRSYSPSVVSPYSSRPCIWFRLTDDPYVLVVRCSLILVSLSPQSPLVLVPISHPDRLLTSARSMFSRFSYPPATEAPMQAIVLDEHKTILLQHQYPPTHRHIHSH